MQIKTHHKNSSKIAEILSERVVLTSVDDALDLIANLSYQGFTQIIIHEKNISTDFFDLKTKIAGDILQKFTQYQMPLVVVEDFSKYESKSPNDFIFESNKGKQINFIAAISNIF